eukprot:Rhum_TRINITY_DN241_c1_g1::Rhum_TRINITY_DN241_c1_g1_i1::g.816::m.816
MGNHTVDVEEARPVTGVVVNSYDGQPTPTPAVVAGVPTRIVVEEVGKEDYLPACLTSALCGIFGVCGTALCCPTNHGKLGAATGYAWFSLWNASALIASLILVALKLISCNLEVFPTDIPKTDCDKWHGNFTDGGCYGVCPSGYDMQHTEKNNFDQWCEHHDPTCTGLSQHSTIIFAVCSFVLFLFSCRFVRKYAREITENPQYQTV